MAQGPSRKKGGAVTVQPKGAFPRSASGIYQFVGSNGLRVTVTDAAKLSKSTAKAGGKSHR